MFIKNRRGFTIIETVLFLAISGLVLLIGFQGIGSRTQTAQYNDSIRDIESTVSQTLRSLSTGYRSSGLSNRNCGLSTGASLPSGGTLGDQAGTTSCINMGTLIEFVDNDEDDLIRTYQITGRRLWNDQLNVPGVSEQQLISNSSPIVNTIDVEEYNIPWGTQFIGTIFQGGTSNDATAFGLLRSPSSSNVFPVISSIGLTNEANANVIANNPSLNFSTGASGNTQIIDTGSVGFKVCVQGASGLAGSVTFAGDLGLDAAVDGDDEDCAGLNP